MLESFRAKNFKCFEDFTIKPLATVNLVTGLNNVGKTALLEAMFLHAGYFNPALAAVINVFRGVEKFRKDHEVLWGWLFSNHNLAATIELTGTDPADVKTVLKISLCPMSQVIEAGSGQEGLLEPSPGLGVTNGSVSRKLLYEYSDSSGQQERNAIWLTPDGKIVSQNPPTERGVAAHFVVSRKRFFEQDADLLDELTRKKRQNELVEKSRVFESRLNGLSVSTAWGPKMIVADLEGQPELMPLAYAGEGLTRIISMLLRILPAAGGLVLIDEIDNGIHHTTLESVWRAIAETANTSKVQVVATTHSQECIIAAHKAFASRLEYDFRLFRLSRPPRKNTIEVVCYDREKLEIAINAGKDVR